jgi:hypothetical protein
VPTLCIVNDAQYLVLQNAKSKVKIHDECRLWAIILIDLLQKDSFQLRWNILRTLLPIVDRFRARNTQLVFISPFHASFSLETKVRRAKWPVVL